MSFYLKISCTYTSENKRSFQLQKQSSNISEKQIEN